MQRRAEKGPQNVNKTPTVNELVWFSLRFGSNVILNEYVHLFTGIIHNYASALDQVVGLRAADGLQTLHCGCTLL